jgi:RNA polymerase sigma-70 factor (ECF subfamily)
MRATDAELVQLTLTGDKAAFGELVRRYQGLVYGLAYHRIGNFADAQDIAQEVFVRAFRRLGQLEQPEQFASWLKTATVNQSKMWLRASRPTIPLDDAETLPSYASTVADKWRSDQRQTEIRQAVEALPEKSRLLVTLHYLSGLSHREIGEFLGMAANAVSQHLHRARQQLRTLLIAQIEEDYAMNKLPESFAEEVLKTASLYPIRDGYVVVGDGGEGVNRLTMAVGEPGPDREYITFWAKADDVGEIVMGPVRGRSADGAKGRALNSALEILKAFGIELERVVLRLSKDRKCRANVELKQGKKELSVDMRPSDAMGLAVRVNAPILVEEAVAKAGNVGEDDVPVPDEDMNHTAYNQEFQWFRQHDTIIGESLGVGVVTGGVGGYRALSQG